MSEPAELRIVDGGLVDRHKSLLKDVEEYIGNARGLLVIIKDEASWDIQVWRNGVDGDQAIGMAHRAIHKMNTTDPETLETLDEPRGKKDEDDE